ncbi:MAG: hypothetical protein M3362_19730 [Acidobacteriota bacterium]|nr:hypothetical protein [Acidobacteriota bacterium]
MLNISQPSALTRARRAVKYRSATFALVLLSSLVFIPALKAQTDEVRLDEAQPKIVTVSAMRVRRGPRVNAEEVMRLPTRTRS